MYIVLLRKNRRGKMKIKMWADNRKVPKILRKSTSLFYREMKNEKI